jgi:hypothetical protein
MIAGLSVPVLEASTMKIERINSWGIIDNQALCLTKGCFEVMAGAHLFRGKNSFGENAT